MARLHRRYRKKHKSNPAREPRRNPPILRETLDYIVPGFAGFAATRLGTRIVATQIAKWKPSWAKHAGAAASIGTFLAAWLLAHRVKMLAKYQAPLMVGSGIAAIQSLIQIYIPMLGWTVSDATPELGAATQSVSALPAGAEHLVPVDDDPNAYTYNDSYDPGAYASAQPGATQQTNSASGIPQAPPAGSSSDEDLLADLDLDQGENQAVGGIFRQ
jgi:hypothetical protein